jgi:hypothetical protein
MESYIQDTMDSLETSLESLPEHYRGGTGEGVLPSLRVWRGRQGVSTRDRNLMLDSNSPLTGGQNTHTHTQELWGKLYTKELACLAQGIPDVSKGTNTIIFIKRKEIPANRRYDTTYARVCVNYRPKKEDPNRTRLTSQ